MFCKYGAPRRGAPSFTAVLGGVFAFALLLSSFFPMARVLVVEVIGHTTHTFEVAVGDTFTSYYFHSLERVPVYEVFSVDSADLRLIISPETEQALLFQDRRVELAQYPRGTRVDIYVVTRPVVWLRLRRAIS
ncbi:MAG TPA: hypothetical protein DCM14_00890 [Clostridiales bacterium UBA8153]|nr:hypothetical protein [Clostridiales bacterium UBA8153]